MKYAYWLDNISGIGCAKIRHMFEVISSAQELYELPLSKLKLIPGLTSEDVHAIYSSRRDWNLDEKWFSLMEEGMGFVCVENSSFPQKLRNISNSRYALYYVG